MSTVLVEVTESVAQLGGVQSLWPVLTARWICVQCRGGLTFVDVVNSESRRTVVEWGRGEVGGRGYKKRQSQVGQQKLFTRERQSLGRGQAPMGRRFHRNGRYIYLLRADDACENSHWGDTNATIGQSNLRGSCLGSLRGRIPGYLACQTGLLVIEKRGPALRL
jgi:hypothetical protein